MSLDTTISPLFPQQNTPTATHIVHLALGSNLGDRRGNLAAALQRLRDVVDIEAVSSVYETEPVGYLEQPRFLNIACCGKTGLSAQELLHYTQAIETTLGRQPSFRNGPRPIDIDILLYDNLRVKEEELTIPHPRMAERAFVLVPLAEISPNTIDPVSGQSAQELLQKVSQEGVTKLAPNLRIALDRDIQSGSPSVHVRLGRAGVVGVRKSLLIGEEGQQRWFDATFDLYADLDTGQAGVHMSRFSDVLEEVLEES
ncbi:MAG TPA: 2-amino-4-hydroxy-6-hydroxymethyldihydropteridine diphosphokinase, partial [Ktedonobacteraceae bacterium]|nr:2-amino-4-hydroxy-6-hydroxymethyldihydropteridine diphosphokinase [Ktedonobacteraceae bacterium]